VIFGWGEVFGYLTAPVVWPEILREQTMGIIPGAEGKREERFVGVQKCIIIPEKLGQRFVSGASVSANGRQSYLRKTCTESRKVRQLKQQ